MSTSAISQQLTALENDLGIRLSDRTRHGVILTEAGRRVLDETGAVLAHLDQAQAAIARIRTREARRLMLGVSPGLDPSLIASLVTGTMMRDNSLQLQPRPAPSAFALASLTRDELDAALIHLIPAEPGVTHLVLSSDELGVALPAGHRLAGRAAVRAADLRGEPVAWLHCRAEPMLGEQVLTRLVDAGFESGPERDTLNTKTSLSLVASDQAISFRFAREVNGDRRAKVVWRPFLDTPIQVPTVLAWRATRRSPVLTPLVEAAREIAENASASTDTGQQTARRGRPSS